MRAWIICLISLFMTHSAFSYDIIDDTAHTGFEIPQASVFLQMQSYQQTTYDTCGPAVVMTLLHFYGRLSDKDMNHDTEVKIAKEMKIGLMGTDQDEMVNWLQNHEFSVESGLGITPEMITQHLLQGTPVIIILIDWSGHAVLTLGYSENRRDHELTQFYFANPSSRSFVTYQHRPLKGITLLTQHELQTMWTNAKYYFNPGHVSVGMYIIAKPKPLKK
jgi:hypothetical protein